MIPGFLHNIDREKGFSPRRRVRVFWSWEVVVSRSETLVSFVLVYHKVHAIGAASR